MQRRFLSKSFLVFSAVLMAATGATASAGQKNKNLSVPVAETIIIDGCDSGIVNQPLDGGVTMNDLIANCAADAANHGAFVSCVAHLTNTWKKEGLIEGQDKGAIQRCAAHANIPPVSASECIEDTDCDDGILCNGTETCVEGICTSGAPAADGESCNDANVCTENDVCTGGACTGIPVGCDDANACTDDSCDPTMGCQYIYNNAACDDGNVCTENDTCAEGICQPGTAVVDGTLCLDEEMCNGEETCEAGVCTPGTPLVDDSPCDDGNVCTENDICAGSTCQPGTNVLDETPCPDEEMCNGEESCQSGVCTPGTPLSDGESCNDGLYCTLTDTCQGGMCTGSDTPCGEGLLCNEDVDTCELPMVYAIKKLFLLWTQGK